MGTRKSRNKLNKNKDFNLMEPLPFDKLGSVDDPCFGKLHNPTATECQMCGDNEICSIVFSQNLNTKRLTIETKQNFKDLQNLEVTWQNLSKWISKKLKANKKPLYIPDIKGPASKELGIDIPTFDKLLIKVGNKSSKISISGNQVKLK